VKTVIPATSIRTIAIGMLTVATNAIATTVAAQGGRTFQMNMFSTANTALDVADMRIATVLENRVTATFLPGDHHDQLVRCPNGLGHASNIAKAWECRPALLGCAPARHDRGGPNLLGGLSVEEIGAGALAG